MSERSNYPDFPDVNFVAETLIKENKFPTTDVSELKANPEFQVFRIIGQNKVISTEKIESKFESQSLSMILSNLQADNLIEQTSDYRWRLPDKIWDLLIKKLENHEETTKQMSEREILAREQQIKNNKKSLYKRIADQLTETTYIPSQHNVEELFKIPELEILAIIYENDAIGTDGIEAKATLGSSVSLGLSNLQADNLIEQNADYQWKLVDSLLQEININNLTISEPSTDGEESGESEIQSQNKIIAHKQLLKAILDIDYFSGKPINEIINTPEFEILNLINTYSPVSSEEIEEKLTEDTLLSLLLSNLSADDLIAQTNDYRWVLAEDFRIRVSKVKVTREELLEQLRIESSEKSTQNTVQSETSINENFEQTDITISAQDDRKGEVVNVQDQTEDKEKKIENPIVSTLIENGYISKSGINTLQLKMLPEFEILTLLAVNEKLSSEEIEKWSHATSVSMTLSNLAADGLIRQREEDFKYELTDKLSLNAEFINSLQDVKRIGSIDDNKSKSEDSTQVEHRPEPTSSITKPNNAGNKEDLVKNLKIAAKKIGYIDNENASLEELNKISDFEVLRIVGEFQPVEEAKIKELAKSSSPVLISRTIFKLEADERISRDTTGNWKFSDSFNKLLVEDVLKERRRLEELEEARRAQEELRIMEQEKEQRIKFIELLKSEGIVDSELSHDKLMSVPEFEVLWIVSKSESDISIDDIKAKAKSADPVLITRTISMLETKGRLQKTLAGNYELSSDLKGL